MHLLEEVLLVLGSHIVVPFQTVCPCSEGTSTDMSGSVNVCAYVLAMNL